MSTLGPILSFAREAGGAAAIAPVCWALRERKSPLLLVANGPGIKAFRDRGFDCVEIGAFDAAAIERLCHDTFGCLPKVVFTSATSLPTLDMTERLLWRWAARHRLPSAALVDQWQNYAIRFSGTDSRERLAYLPDRILLMDERARREAIADGLPVERLVVTGQPAFDDIRREHEALSADYSRLRNALRVPEGAMLITFVAESLAADYGDQLGYDEQSTLKFLGDLLQGIAGRAGRQFLAVKLHPQNKSEQFEWALEHWPDVTVCVVASERTPREMIVMSDIVVGMSSVMLIEAIIAAKPTVSLELNAKREAQLVATRAGAIPELRTAVSARRVLENLLLDVDERERYLARQSRWGIQGDAVGRCIDVLSRMDAHGGEKMQC